MFQTKEQDKSPETELSEREMSDLLEREFKIMVIKILTEVGRAMHEQNDTFNKEIENIKKYQTEIIELKNTITELRIQ